MSNYLLLGYYGFGNAGDEAVLLAIGSYLAEGGEQVGVLTQDPQSTKELLAPYRVQTFRRNKPWDIFQGILWADYLVLGGGSLLQNVTSSRSLHYYLTIARLAQVLGRPVVLFAQGLGPLSGGFNRCRVSKVAREARAISVRDGDSRDLFWDIGILPEHVELVADPVWWLDLNERMAFKDLGGDGYLLFALRPWQGKEELLEVALEKLREETQLPFVFVAMHPEFDLPLARKLAVKVGGEVAEVRSLEALFPFFAQAELVCAMRLHALIFASLFQKKAVAISYDPKVDALSKELGLTCLALDEELSLELPGALQGAKVPGPKVTELRKDAERGLRELLTLGRAQDGAD